MGQIATLPSRAACFVTRERREGSMKVRCPGVGKFDGREAEKRKKKRENGRTAQK